MILKQLDPSPSRVTGLIFESKVVHLYSAFITNVSKAINLPPADWKQIQAQMAAASKQSMHAGTHFTDLGRIES